MSLNIFNKFRRDEKRVADGAPMVIGTTDAGAKVAIFVSRLHQSNVAFKTFVENAKRTIQTALDKADDETRTKLLEDITYDAVEQVLIRGWTNNMCDNSGDLISYTADAVKRIRTELPELFDLIVEFAADAKNYVGEFKEDENLKN